MTFDEAVFRLQFQMIVRETECREGGMSTGFTSRVHNVYKIMSRLSTKFI